MSSFQLLLAVAIGVATNELCDVSPWLARRLVRWSARHQYVDANQATERAEELAALIDQRPGKLFKLLTAFTFAAAACAAVVRRVGVGRYGTLGHAGSQIRAALADDARFAVSRHLGASERFRGEWRRHWVHLGTRGVSAVVVVAVAAASYGLVVAVDGGLVAYVLATMVVVLCGSLIVGWRMLRWYHDRIVLTDQRLLVVRGIVVRTTVAVPLVDLHRLVLVQSAVARFLNYGTFVFAGRSDRSTRRLRNLPNPVALYLHVMEGLFDPVAAEARRAQHAVAGGRDVVPGR